MPVSRSFVDHALDLLALAGPVRARRMFGGYGLYAGGGMFGLLDDDELFLKTDEACRPEFLAAGCRQWVYQSPSRGAVPTGYYRPPDGAHEDAEAMLPWARLALGAAARAAAAKAAKGQRRLGKAKGRSRAKEKVRSRVKAKGRRR